MCRRNFSDTEFKKCFACKLKLDRREEEVSRRILYPFPSSYQVRLYKRLCCSSMHYLIRWAALGLSNMETFPSLLLLSSLEQCTSSKSLPRNCLDTEWSRKLVLWLLLDTDSVVEDFYKQRCLPGLLCSTSSVLECCAGF